MRKTTIYMYMLCTLLLLIFEKIKQRKTQNDKLYLIVLYIQLYETVKRKCDTRIIGDRHTGILLLLLRIYM